MTELKRPIDAEASLGTAEGSLEYWRTRHMDRPHWAKTYWDSQQLEERSYVLRALRRLDPFESVVELGCNAGPNLALIRRNFPSVELTGVDINEEALRFCRQAFAEESLGEVQLRRQSLYELDDVPSSSADVVLTSSVLIHVPPDRVRHVAATALRVARRAVVMLELHAFVPDQVAALARPGKWCRSFWQVLDGLLPLQAITIEELPPSVRFDLNERDGRYYESVNAVITALKK